MGAGIHTRVPTEYSGDNDSVEPNPNLGRNETSHIVYGYFLLTLPIFVYINWRQVSLLACRVRNVYETLMELSSVSRRVAEDGVVGGFPTAVLILSVVFRRSSLLRVEVEHFRSCAACRIASSASLPGARMSRVGTGSARRSGTSASIAWATWAPW